MQVASDVDPRRVLRKGSAAFCRLYRLFSDGLFAAKIFLTAALHDPVMYVLSQDELFLDIDPSKSAIRFPPEERRKRFGEDENSLSYLQKLTAHRRVIESKLIAISTRFVQGVMQAMNCFPQSLGWLVRELHSTLIERKKVTAEQASLICTDLIFTYLICPAIANPETLGVICDTPVTYIARFNLMQVGQILQTLALAPFEQPHPHLAYFYSHFEQNPMAQVVQRVLESSGTSLEKMFVASSADSHGCDHLVRRFFAGTFVELNCLHSALRSVALDRLSDANIRRELRAVMRRLPARFDAPASPNRASETKTAQRRRSLATKPGQDIVRNSSLSPGRSRNTTLRTLADRVQNAAQRGQQRLRSQHSSRAGNSLQDEANSSNIEVLMFPLGDAREPLGLCCEDKFMESVRQPLTSRKHKTSDGAAEKRTRFLDTESLGMSDRATDAGSDDDEEGASLCSSMEGNGDALEDDGEDVSTLPDNFSDVGLISANVSGRGSPSVSGPPSVSGRDTPHSAHTGSQHQGNSTAASHGTAAAHQANMPNLPMTVRRENSEGLEDKFGKFALPQQEGRHRYRDDTHSLVSDSWSTDVLPSDTEGFSADTRHDGTNALGTAHVTLQPPGAGAPPLPMLPVVAEVGQTRSVAGAASRISRLVPNTSGGGPSLGVSLSVEDRSDTWSVDAMASDSEADPVHRNDDILLIDEPERAQHASPSSGGGNTPMLMPVENDSSLSAGGLSATSQAQQLHSSSAIPHEQAEDILAVHVHAPPQQCRRKDVTIFGELVAVTSIQSGVSSASIGEGSRERIRRQSSGSSFYSKSDVDSEFSKDLNDDALSSLLGDYTPSFRNSIGEMAVVTPASPATSVPATAGSFSNEYVHGQMSVEQMRGRSLSPSKNSKAPADKTAETDNTCDEPVMITKRRAEADMHSERCGVVQLNEDEIRASWASTGAMPKLVRRSALHADSNITFPGQAGGASSSSFTRKKITLFQGLQKMGESLKMKRGMAVSSLRQSLSQASTMNELASVSLDSNMPSNDTTSFRHSIDQRPTSVSTRRLTGSRSMGELGSSRESYESTANEILDKYKGRAPIFGEASSKVLVSNGVNTEQKTESLRSPAAPYYDANNVTQCRAFLDAKRKLRLVLSSVGSIPSSSNTAITTRDNLGVDSLQVASNGRRSGELSDADHLVNFLQILLAESINGHDKMLSAQIREVLRCLTVFDDKGVHKLLRTLKDEHRKRTAYLLYLQQSRLTLLQLRSYLEKLSSRLQREKSLTVECLVEVLVRFYLEQRDIHLRRFTADFQLLKAQDERTDTVERTLSMLYARMPMEAMWKHADTEMLAYARKSLERSLMAQVYVLALYPNGDADQCRDSVFHRSLRKLAQVTTPDHSELRIPSRFHGECPWPSAQAEIAIINAYKSPRDKMACVVRCCETIENLISLAAERGAASADDITPVLVYVLIQANPQALLSNIQYINGFYSNRMEGAEAYWWAQFTSAVEFIKTLLNHHHF
uniref:Receptor-mediated endocytosis protein 6 n=1 Tax=Ascaris suum TaxID=6253 RepID=F1KQR4_ASCSU